MIDTGGNVRAGEELDRDAVVNWLSAQGVELIPLNDSEPCEVTQYSGGASNWTYRLKFANRDLILRRPPKGTKAKSAHDMVREYTIQQALKEQYPLVPDMVALCTNEAVIGCDFYVMDRIEGIIPRANLPKGLTLSEAQVRELCQNVIDALIELHQVNYHKNSALLAMGKGEGYCERQVMGWDKRYEQARTPDVPDFAEVRDWLKAHIPADTNTCVIHNDWRFDNVILDPNQPTKVIGVLDWEMATLGDPLMDLGCALAYWIQADDNAIMKATRRQPTNLAGMMTRQQVVDYYLAKTGLSVSNWAFYEVFGVFRLAGIAQQIYYRFYHGQTDNPAFKDFGVIVGALHDRCVKMIASTTNE